LNLQRLRRCDLILLFPNRLARDPHQAIGMSAIDIAHP